MKPTPLRPLRPSRRLMRDFDRASRLRDFLNAVAGWAAVVAIGGMAAVGILGN